MSVTGEERFSVESLPIAGVESGQSILLTGDDSDALKTVFARLLAAPEDEHSIILTTNQGGRPLRRELDQARANSGTNSSILACEGPARGDNITRVEDISDLTTLGMQFSNLVASAQGSGGRFRSGIFLCSSICSEVDDTRSVYRFLNTTFMTDLRRGDGIGVCAVDTSATLDTDVESMISGMETSLSARIHVEQTDSGDTELTFTGFDQIDGTVTTSL
jgi:hypothetical protein